ncbi:MAG: hypothetical protein KC586_14715, partial [Myxococcales bacterium]|nr:hypothetical protein [Myxococcales bacterium]
MWLSFVVLAALACGDDDGVARDGGSSDGGTFDGALDSAVDASQDAEPPVSDDGGEDAGDAGTDAGAVDRYDDVLAAFETESSASALDALLTDVGHVEGWPLVSGERWLFATRWDAVTGVAWVGDPNAWNVAANPARSAPSGVHYFVEIVGIAAPRGAKYKWWSDGTFRAPPESTVYGEDEFGEHGYVAPPTDVAFFERFPGFAGEGVASRTVRVRVPSDFAWERRVG